jgi:hypothetical protein
MRCLALATYAKNDAMADANSKKALSKAIASMITEMPLAENKLFQDFFPFGLYSPRFLTNTVTLDPLS